MSTDTDKTITDNAVISEEILGKIENAAREGARQGSKESRGGRGEIGLFETIKTLILTASQRCRCGKSISRSSTRSQPGIRWKLNLSDSPEYDLISAL